MKNEALSFSFSGLKTQVLYTAKGQGANKHSDLIIKEEEKKHLAASFQETALGDVVNKLRHAFKTHSCHALVLGGGVTHNQRLRQLVEEAFSSIPVLWPPKGLSLDNAAMIAGLAYQQFLKQGPCDLDELQIQTRIPLHS